MNRSVRRHHMDRMKKKARHIAGVIWRYAMGDTRHDDVVDAMVKNANHLKSCGCQMCQNPRRSKWSKASGKTRNEIEADNLQSRRHENETC